jgi:hypothetical protein
MGIETVNVVPVPTMLLILIVPDSSSIAFFTMESPRPVP